MCSAATGGGRGRGWRRATARFCPPGEACTQEGYGILFRADRRGRFTFRFVYGPRVPRGLPRPAAAGGGQRDMLFQSGRVSRDAIPPPPPSTPAQRLEARRLATVVRLAKRDVLRRRRAMQRRHAAHERELGRCREHLSRFPDDSPEDRVVWAVLDLARDEAFLRGYGPALPRFAARLERLRLRDRVLRAGADAWIAAIRRRDRPYPRPSLCAVLDAWAATGYDMARRPVDPEAARAQQLLEEVGDSDAIAEAAARLRALGAGRNAEEDFAFDLLSIGELIS